MIKTYGVHDHWTDIAKKNDIDIMSVDGVIEEIKVNGEAVGGGGESDFSTAEVTINANQQFEFYAPLINDEHGYLGSYDNINPSESVTLTVGLYKGKALTQFITDGVVSVSGNAQLMNEQILITGGCTITISK